MALTAATTKTPSGDATTRSTPARAEDRAFSNTTGTFGSVMSTTTMAPILLAATYAVVPWTLTSRAPDKSRFAAGANSKPSDGSFGASRPACTPFKYSGAPYVELLNIENVPPFNVGVTTYVYARSPPPTPTHAPLALSNRLSLTLPTSCIVPAEVYFNVVTLRVIPLIVRSVCLSYGPNCILSIPES